MRQLHGPLRIRTVRSAGHHGVPAPVDTRRAIEIEAPGSPSRLGALAVTGAVAAGYVGLVTGARPVDLGIGRRTRPLGPQVIEIGAARDIVFDVVAQPYLGRSTRAMREKVQVLERGSDMVLAAHFTPVGGRLTATTVETVGDEPVVSSASTSGRPGWLASRWPAAEVG